MISCTNISNITFYFVYLAVLSLKLLFASSQYDDIVSLRNLKNNEIAIIQYDSRKLRDYWLVSALWNKKYCDKHGHVYIYYTSKSGCYYQNNKDSIVIKEKLATPWCKVKAMLNANREYPSVKLFIYMDSDAVIDKSFAYTPLQTMLGLMQDKLQWNPINKPIVFNQDGPCWWCNLIQQVGYTMCLNAGTLVWYRHKMSEYILQSWWDASMDSYLTNPIKRKFRLKWPWEQDRQMAVYNRSSELIQIASQPKRSKMQTRVGLLTNGPDTGWCLSHLPGWGCFISHYCSSSHSKQVLKSLYSTTTTTATITAKDDDQIKKDGRKYRTNREKNNKDQIIHNITINYLKLS